MSAFLKSEEITFDKVVQGFTDGLVMTETVARAPSLGNEQMERQADTIWRPMPYISTVYNGLDQTGNFGSKTQLAVPATVGFKNSVPIQVSATELRDPLQLTRIGESAAQGLASKLNYNIFNVAALLGSVYIKRSGAPTGFDDVAEADATFTEQGIGPSAGQRTFVAAPRAMNGIASNMAARGTVGDMVSKAYREAYVDKISNFDVVRGEYSYQLAASAGGNITIAGANQYYVPKAMSTATTGEQSPVDNRFQTIAVSANAGVKAGDAFNIAGVFSTHHITKQPTAALKTFRVVALGAVANTLIITPPIISGGGGTLAELDYKNVSAAPAAGAAITWLNTTTANVSPFFCKGALELMPADIAPNPADGWNIMKATTPQGVTITYARQGDINTYNTKIRWDTSYGVTMLNPEMAGAMQFNQA
jgi:hypothetical protein